MSKLQNPSDFIKKILEKNELTVVEIAKKTGLVPNQIYGLISGKLKITEKTALKFEKAFDVPARKLLLMQMEWRLEYAREKFKI